MRNGTVVCRGHGKCGQEDLDELHNQPKDDRHGRRSLPVDHAIHRVSGFLKEDTVLKVPHGTEDLSSRRNVPKEEEKGCQVRASRHGRCRRAGITTMLGQHG